MSNSSVVKRFVMVFAVVGMVFTCGLTFTGNLFAEAEHAAASSDSSAVILKVTGMTCGACANKVQTALEGCDGVQAVKVSTKAGRAVVKVAKGKSTSSEMIEAVKKAGFQAEVGTGVEDAKAAIGSAKEAHENEQS